MVVEGVLTYVEGPLIRRFPATLRRSVAGTQIPKPAVGSREFSASNSWVAVAARRLRAESAQQGAQSLPVSARSSYGAIGCGLGKRSVRLIVAELLEAL